MIIKVQHEGEKVNQLILMHQGMKYHVGFTSDYNFVMDGLEIPMLNACRIEFEDVRELEFFLRSIVETISMCNERLWEHLRFVVPEEYGGKA